MEIIAGGIVLEPPIRQIFPGRVALLNQSDLSGSTPALEGFLAGNRVTNVHELLKVHEPSDVVRRREAGSEAPLVLIHPPGDLVRDAYVQHSGATGHDVHAVWAHAH